MSVTIHKFEKNMLHGSDVYITEKRDGAWSKKHWHNYYEIIYYKKAKGVCILNGERVDLSDESLFLLTPKDFHEVKTEVGKEYHAFIIAFNERMPDASVIDALTKGPIVFRDISERLSDKLSELYELFSSEEKYAEQRLRHLFNCIVLEVLEGARVYDSADSEISPAVRESISLMLSDPTSNFSLEFFAKKFNITEAYFSRLFHKHAGVTFKQYLTELRLEYAKQLLNEKTISVIDVGYECGFNTPSQFYRAFKSTYGITPSEYRKNGR